MQKILHEEPYKNLLQDLLSDGAITEDVSTPNVTKRTLHSQLDQLDMLTGISITTGYNLISFGLEMVTKDNSLGKD